MAKFVDFISKVKEQKNIIQWLLLAVLAFTWGSSFILMKKALFSPSGETLFNAYEVAGLRLLIASVSLMPVWIYKARKIKRNFIPLATVGLIGSGMPALMFTLAETKISSSLAGMLNATVPIMAAIISLVFFSVKIEKRKVTGIVIGLIGVVGLIGFDFNTERMGYALLILIATTGYATSVTTIKYKLSHLSAVEITSLSFSFVFIPSLLYLLYDDTFIEIGNNFDQYGSALLYTFLLGFFGTAVAVILYSRLVAISDPVFASSVTYLIPVVATFWGLVFGEVITFLEIVSMGIIVGSIFVIRSKVKAAKNKHT